MGKRGTKLSPATEEALNLAFLKDEMDAMTKEYLFLCRDLSDRVIPTTAYPNRWRTIHRKMETLNNALKEKNYYIEEDGVHLKESYEIENERRAYLRYILIRLLAPAAKLDSPFDRFMERYYTQTAYTEKELDELDAFTLRLEEIFNKKELPKCPDFLHFPSELKVYLNYLRDYFYPLRDILSEIWHGTLKEGADLSEFFRKYEKTETLSAFRSLPFPALFEIAGEKILLNEISEEMFLFFLSGLMTKELNNKHAAWELYVTIYFHGCNKGAFSPKE